MVALDDRHLQGALALSTEAHWNQTLDDWKMMMAAGNAIGLVDPGGRLVGSALASPTILKWTCPTREALK